MTDAGHGADAGLAPGARQAAVDRVEELASGARGVEELLASITGRWPRVRLLHRYTLSDVADPPLSLLDTTGPVLGRSMELSDPDDPDHHPAGPDDPAGPGGAGTDGAPGAVAVSTELIVLDRLPATVTAELTTTGDPLDGVLDRFAVDWDSELIHTQLIPDQITSVQVLRRIWIGAEIVALLSEEYPLHPNLVTDHQTGPGGPDGPGDPDGPAS